MNNAIIPFDDSFNIPFIVTMPHSGEKVPDQCDWLKALPEEILMCDVDRYIDVLYEKNLELLDIPFVKTEWHRYAVDLNRIPEDVDADSVIGSNNKSGLHSRGYHWVTTTQGDQLMRRPISIKQHSDLTNLIYEPFHKDIRKLYDQFKKDNAVIYHLDAHSMPSVGTSMHKDPGQRRADIVVSDCLGKSCGTAYKDLVIKAYINSGFTVGYNWPYMGGRVTEQYGHPNLGQQVLQVELNRDLYMNEVSKKIKPDYVEVQKKIFEALETIKVNLQNI